MNLDKSSLIFYDRAQRTDNDLTEEQLREAIPSLDAIDIVEGHTKIGQVLQCRCNGRFYRLIVVNTYTNSDAQQLSEMRSLQDWPWRSPWQEAHNNIK
ncbi:hypothetical protein Ciccas_006554 [Cichlidogyrus casuarinus]|uniref:Uncharacterized protein n=1 Tax=Cichlidogyrus casuarinus TaxID=1844966 RepID=A0ABD2Q5G8_9PLAT